MCSDLSLNKNRKTKNPTITEEGLYARLLLIRAAIDLRTQGDEDGEPGMGG